MNKKEVLEIRKRTKKDNASFTDIAGCYVDGDKNKVSTFVHKFLTLDEEDIYKYLEIASKALSGKLDNNLLNISFPLQEEEKGGRQNNLMILRNSGLKDENILNAFYDEVIDTYDNAGNYLILLFHDAYDVMTRTKDNEDLDESEEVYDYLICAICPVELSKPGLSYHIDENMIAARDRDWVVKMPESGFLFPAFNDRSTDIHSMLFYTKNAKALHTEFIENCFGCDAIRTSSEKKDLFLSMLGQNLGMEEEDTGMQVLDINLALSAYVEEGEYEHVDEDNDWQIVTEDVLDKALTDADVSEKKKESIKKTYKEAFSETGYPKAEELIDDKLLANSNLLLENRTLKEQNAELNRALESHGSMYSADKIRKMYTEYEKTEKSVPFPEWLLS